MDNFITWFKSKDPHYICKHHKLTYCRFPLNVILKVREAFMFKKDLRFAKGTCFPKITLSATEAYSKLLILDVLQGSEYAPAPSLIGS